MEPLLEIKNYERKADCFYVELMLVQRVFILIIPAIIREQRA